MTISKDSMTTLEPCLTGSKTGLPALLCPNLLVSQPRPSKANSTYLRIHLAQRERRCAHLPTPFVDWFARMGKCLVADRAGIVFLRPYFAVKRVGRFH